MKRREFTAKVKLAAFQRANGHCEISSCGARLYTGKFRYDHRVPDQLGGDSSLENCQVICIECDRIKTPRDQSNIAKAHRRERKHAGIRRPRTIKAWRRFNGEIVRVERER